MSTPTTPTEGAMRAAERILARLEPVFGCSTQYDVVVANIIDAELRAETGAPQLAQRVKELELNEARLHALEDALRKIADHEIDGPLDEWAEAVAYHECKSIASGAIVTSPEAALQSPTSAQVGTEEITDTRRLDWLDGEMERERDAIRRLAPLPGSLFRKNVPITRAAIDSAISLSAESSAAMGSSAAKGEGEAT